MHFQKVKKTSEKGKIENLYIFLDVNINFN